MKLVIYSLLISSLLFADSKKESLSIEEMQTLIDETLDKIDLKKN